MQNDKTCQISYNFTYKLYFIEGMHKRIAGIVILATAAESFDNAA
jgi:hypothetical protein